MSSLFEEEPLRPQRGVTFGHEESITMDPVRGPMRDPFLARRPVTIEEDGILGADTRLHPAYAQRKEDFDERARRRFQGDEPSMHGAPDPEELEIERELADEHRRANEQSAAGTRDAGLPNYDASKSSRSDFAALINQRNAGGQAASSFDDLFGEIEAKEQAKPDDSTPWREVTNPDAEPIGRGGEPSDPGAARFHMQALAASFGKAASPASTSYAGPKPRGGYLKATPNTIRYGEGRNAESRPTSYFPNSSWAVKPHAQAPSEQVGTGQKVPFGPNTRTNRVMGQYWRTFGERSQAGAGFFGALFGRGMRRANARVEQGQREESLAGLAQARAAKPHVAVMSDGLDHETANRRRRLMRRADRINEGRGGFEAPDQAAGYENFVEQLGYRIEGKVGQTIPEADIDEEEID